MKRSITHHLPCLIALICLAAPVSAQQPGTLEVLRSLSLDSLGGAIPVYYSPGYRERAESLQRMYEAALAFYEDTLAYDFDARLAVLTDEHWAALDWGTPYGMPWYSYRDAVPVVIMPATTDHGVVVDLLRPRFGDEAARRGVETIGFHELGHAIVQEYLYPGDTLRTPSVRWFDEMMATYVGQGYQWLTVPGTLARARRRAPGERATGGSRPTMTSLDDLEANYWTLAKSPDGRNYGWYQGQLAARAAAVFEDRGLDFLQQVKETLPWERLTEWTSDDLLGWLEGIEPGFEAWAASLER